PPAAATRVLVAPRSDQRVRRRPTARTTTPDHVTHRRSAADRATRERSHDGVRRRARRPRARGLTMSCVIAIDAGTTGVRAFAVGDDGQPRARSYREFRQHFPRPGWVERDPDDIWQATSETLAEVVRELHDRGEARAAVGITNQRETG